MAQGRSLASLAALFALAACGGGGGTAAPPPSTAADAVLSVSLSGGASPGIDHLWVTVTGLAMHADATHVFGDGDPGWIVQTLSTPVTVDLADASSTNNSAVSLFKQSVSTFGSFAQLRLLVAPSDPSSTLASSASAKGLQFNDQVQYTDATGVHVVPLELPDAQAGLRVLAPFNLSSDTTTPLAIEWNANSLVRRAGVGVGADNRFTLRNELQGYNQQLLSALGNSIDGSFLDSISGQLATINFCTGTSHVGCIHDVVASATSLSPDGRFHREVRSVNVSATGAFLLYPLPSDPAYDVVIRGGNMRTMIVHNVIVDPTGVLRPFPTALGSPDTPMVPVLDTTERAVTLASALVPAGSRVFFGQTVAGSGGGGADTPYTIATGATDPASGRLLQAVTLPGGPLQYASFDPANDGNGAAPTFATVTPTEGIGAWTVWSQGTLATTTSAMTTLAAGASTATVADPVPRAGLASGKLTVTLSGTPGNGADHAELIVSNDGGIVAVVDVSSQIASHGGTTDISVPTGESADAPAAAVYGVALRTWAAASESTTVRWIRAGAPTNMSATTTASVSLALP
ncbi:MAG: DUF4382 domain-containing protein [Burkholderiales bacterium]|nr:DUF4382 domain-containing protein [Burkholderiales bacterium]